MLLYSSYLTVCILLYFFYFLIFCSVLSGEASPHFHLLFSSFRHFMPSLQDRYPCAHTSFLNCFPLPPNFFVPPSLLPAPSVFLLTFPHLSLYRCSYFAKKIHLLSEQHRYTSNAYSSQCRSSNNP